jgi:hypothetical protein
MKKWPLKSTRWSIEEEEGEGQWRGSSGRVVVEGQADGGGQRKL